MTAKEFVELVKSNLEKHDRKFSYNILSLGGGDDMLSINFYNLPKNLVSCVAEAENNRMLFIVSGFGGDKLKAELRVTALPKEYKLRAKSGKAEVVGDYLVKFIDKVVAEVKSNYTHTKGMS